MGREAAHEPGPHRRVLTRALVVGASFNPFISGQCLVSWASALEAAGLCVRLSLLSSPLVLPARNSVLVSAAQDARRLVDITHQPTSCAVQTPGRL